MSLNSPLRFLTQSNSYDILLFKTWIDFLKLELYITNIVVVT